MRVYDGDRAEHGWVARIESGRQPYLAAESMLTREQRAMRTPEEAFQNMASLHGETIGFVIDDLLTMRTDRVVLVDYFGNTPHDLAPLPARPEHAVFLLPTKFFRERTLGVRFADRRRAHANWGDTDLARAFANRLARDELWDAEIRRQAAETGLPTVTVDGSETVEELADELARRFDLD